MCNVSRIVFYIEPAYFLIRFPLHSAVCYLSIHTVPRIHVQRKGNVGGTGTAPGRGVAQSRIEDQHVAGGEPHWHGQPVEGELARANSNEDGEAVRRAEVVVRVPRLGARVGGQHRRRRRRRRRTTETIPARYSVFCMYRGMLGKYTILLAYHAHIANAIHIVRAMGLREHN